jgi:cysteine desulfurase
VIYLDHNASTPMHREVREAMLPFLGDAYGNPSSTHALGSYARCAIEDARARVAALLGARPSEIVFTSGGSESNNLAIQGGVAERVAGPIVSSPIEHASVRETVGHLVHAGRALEEIPVDWHGRVDLDSLRKALHRPVALVSIGWANNEVGTIQPIDEISVLCRAHGVTLHVDAVQAAGRLPLSVHGLDLLSLSAHKFGGPKGVGVLFVRSGVPLRRLAHGGGQERGLRAGTENVAGIVGMGEACRLAQEIGPALAERLVAVREALWAALVRAVPEVVRNSPAGADCLPNTLNVSFAGVRGEVLVAALDLVGIAISAGSACSGGAGEPSHVLLGMGRDPEAARDAVRFSFGWTNADDDVELVVAATAVAVAQIRAARR